MDGYSTRRLAHTIRRQLNDMPDIGFRTQVKRHFGFLVTEKGYRCTESSQLQVRFESTRTFVELVYDANRSFELGLLVGESSVEANRNPPFSIDEILRLRRAPEAKRFSLVQVTSRELMASFIEQFAQMLRAYGEDFVAGNEQSFIELTEQRRREMEIYALERDLRKARAEADKAWVKKDYPSVVKALQPLRAALTAAEVGKLEFAEKQPDSESYN